MQTKNAQPKVASRVERIRDGPKHQRVENGVLRGYPPLAMPHERVEHRELARGVVAEVPRIHKEEVRQPAGKKQPRDLQCHPDWGGEAQKNRGERPQAKIPAGFPERVEDHEQEREVQKRDDRAAHHGEIEGTGGSWPDSFCPTRTRRREWRKQRAVPWRGAPAENSSSAFWKSLTFAASESIKGREVPWEVRGGIAESDG